MPIKPEYKKFYGKEWRTVTRPRILERAGNCCEQCGKPNHARVVVVTVGQFQFWRSSPHRWARCADGRTFSSQAVVQFATDWEPRELFVVLTIAHLNNTPGDDRDENLKALCQWCHLNQDQAFHRQTRAARKDAARPLLQAAL
jgi:hypothetical protein